MDASTPEIDAHRAATAAKGAAPTTRRSEGIADTLARHVPWRASVRDVLLTLAGVLPLVVALINASDSGLGEAWSFAASGVSAVLVAGMVRHVRALSLTALSGVALLAALGLWYEIAVSWAWLPEGAVHEATRWLALTLGMVAAAMAATESAWAARAMVGAGVVAATAVAATTGWQVLGEGLPETRLRGPLGYWNASAAGAAVAAVAAVRLSWAKQWWWRATAAPIAALAGLCVAATVSRGAMYALLVGVLWVTMLDRRRIRVLPLGVIVMASVTWGVVAGPRVDEWLAILVTALLAAALMVAGHVAATPPEKVRAFNRRAMTMRVAIVVVLVAGIGMGLAVWKGGDIRNRAIPDTTETTRLFNPSVNVRWAWWSEAVRTWRDAPLVGRGGDAFAAREDVRSTDTYYVAARPHNLALQVLVETGIVGLVMALAGFLLIGREVVRRRPKDDRGPYAATPGWFASAAAVTIFVQALADWTLGIPTIAALFALFLGVALARDHTEVAAEAASRKRELPRVFADAMVVPVCIGLFALTLLPLAAGLLVRDAERELDDDPGRARWESALAWQLSPSGEALALRTTATELTRGREHARRVLLAGLERLERDRTAWAAAGGIAIAWEDEELRSRAEERQAHLDPLLRITAAQAAAEVEAAAAP